MPRKHMETSGKIMKSSPKVKILSMIFWLVVWNMNFIFHFIYGMILPIDFHIFQDG